MCEVACSSFHFGGVSPSLSRIRVAKLEETGLDMAVSCVSCLQKPCLPCPSDALSTGENGQIILDIKLCDGCKACVEACPVGAIGFYDNLPLFCDLCGGAISCVGACTSKALSFREDYRDVSLTDYLQAEGNPGQRRAVYVRSLGEPVRERWRNGVRIDT